MIEIRKATIKDLKDIREMNQELFKYDQKNFDKTIDVKWAFSKAHNDCYVKDISGKNSAVFLALVDAKIVGYILCKTIDAEIYSKSKKMAFLEDMFIKEEYRSLGLGSDLAQTFFKWAKLQGLERAKVEVSIKNKKAINFYQKNKFKDHDLVLERKI